MINHSSGCDSARVRAHPLSIEIGRLLVDGPATVSELCAATASNRSTVSHHLEELRRQGVVRARRAGRHATYELAGEPVGDLVTALAGTTPFDRFGRRPPLTDALARARTCYDHVAGRLGVDVFDALLERGALRRDGTDVVALGGAAAETFRRLGVDVEDVAARRRVLIRTCRDWTERRPHLGGALGGALCGALFERGWIARGRGRSVHVTQRGRRGLARTLSVRMPASE